MKIIISPAKKMKVQEEFEWRQLPQFIEKTKQLHQQLIKLNPQEIATCMKCNEKNSSTDI